MKIVTLSLAEMNHREGIYDSVPLIPGCHLMFAGPLSCAHHGMGVSVDYQRLGRVSYFYTQMADEAKGTYLNRMLDAAKEIAAADELSCLAVLRPCQSAVLCMDHTTVERMMEDELGIPVRIIEIHHIHEIRKNRKTLYPVIN